MLCVSRGVKADIHWWQMFCAPWNGICLLTPSLPSVKVHTDASGRKGMDGVCCSKWFSACLPGRYQDRDIQFKEVFAVLHAILCWRDTWAGHHLTFFCDNQAVVAWLTSGTCHSNHAMPIIWLISMMAACLCFSYSCVWIPTEENMVADAASCFQYNKLFQLAPHLGWISSMKSQLTGLRRTLTSLDVSPSTSGMAWHPALKKNIHQANNLTLTLSGSVPPFSMPQNDIFQQQAVGSLSGLHHSVIVPSCPRQLNPTSQVFVPCMSMQDYLLNVANHLQSSASSEASSISMEKKLTPKIAHHTCNPAEAHFGVWRSGPQR